MICGSGGSKSRLAKAAGDIWGDEKWKVARRCGAKHISKSKCTKHTSIGPLLGVEMSNKCTPLWREAHFQVKMYKTHHSRTTFGSWDVEKVPAVVARSTFPSQNVQNTPFSDHFWKLRCRKSARRCGGKHISKSKVLKTDGLGPLLEVQMSKKCRNSARFWKLRWRKSARRCGTKHISKSNCTKHTMFGPLLEVQMSKKCTSLWREAHFEVKMLKTPGVPTTFGGSDVASLHYTTGHYTALHSSTLHYTTLRSSTLHYTKLHYTTLHYTEWHCNTDRQVDRYIE